MRAINHALTGAFIGLTVNEPAVALPAAIASHFVLDVIPHHGSESPPMKWMRSRTFKHLLLVDALLCVILVAVLAATHPVNWLLAVVCAFLSAAPDFASVDRFVKALKNSKWRPGAYARFATTIQWFEKPIGWLVEAAWFIAGLLLLAPFLR